jgi:hypothetical protein
LRGAGPSFGIVTAWTYATLPAPDNIGYVLKYEPAAGGKDAFSSAFSSEFPISLTLKEAGLVGFLGFQHFARNAPSTLGFALAIVPDGVNKLVFSVSQSVKPMNYSEATITHSFPETSMDR